MKYYVELSQWTGVFHLGKLYPVINDCVMDETGVSVLVMCYVDETGYVFNSHTEHLDRC